MILTRVLLLQIIGESKGKTCYTWSSITCEEQTKQEVPAKWKVSIELPLGAFKPGLCHPSMYDNLQARLKSPDSWEDAVAGAFGGEEYVHPLLRVPPVLDTKLLVEGLPVGPTPVVQDDIFIADMNILNSNAFWLLNLYLGTALSNSSPAAVLNSFQYHWNGNKLKRAMVLVIQMLCAGAREGKEYTQAAAAVQVSVLVGGKRCLAWVPPSLHSVLHRFRRAPYGKYG